MRIVLAMLKHETNTFSPVPTPIERFMPDGRELSRGEAALKRYRNTGSALGAFIKIAEERGAEIVLPLAAHAWPSSPVEDDAFETMADMICAAFAEGCDMALLDLHGAMVTGSHEDGEGELLRRIRQIAPKVPIGVSLDMHANLSEAIVSNASVIAGYQTYPHVDIYETGMRVGAYLLGAFDAGITPVMTWGSRPMLPHIMRQSTFFSPNRELQAMARDMEAEPGVLATFFTGFPHADIRDAGVSAVVVTRDDAGKADALCTRILDAAWDKRDDFVFKSEPLDQSVARAQTLEGGPIVLLDHCDNTSSGGTMDCMPVLGEILRQELNDVVVFAIHDPDAVQQMIAAGIGSDVTVSLGGKAELASIRQPNPPLSISGRVKLISDGRFTSIGPMNKGVQWNMGPTVVLDTGAVQIVVISRHQEPNDLGCMLSLGIDPREKRFVMLKSRVHFRAAFQPIAKHVVECAGHGVCTSDYGQLNFVKVRRPIFPLDGSVALGAG